MAVPAFAVGAAIFVKDLVVSGMQTGGLSSKACFSLNTLRELSRSQKMNGLVGFPYLLYWAYFKAAIKFLLTILFGEKFANIVANLYRRSMGRQAI